MSDKPLIMGPGIEGNRHQRAVRVEPTSDKYDEMAEEWLNLRGIPTHGFFNNPGNARAIADALRFADKQRAGETCEWKLQLCVWIPKCRDDGKHDSLQEAVVVFMLFSLFFDDIP